MEAETILLDDVTVVCARSDCHAVPSPLQSIADGEIRE
jgi:hypothetical protein